MKESKKCPLCGKRVFDVLKPPNEQIEIAVEIKCLHCKNIVVIPFVENKKAKSKVSTK
jgi:hypothetical protein